MQILNFLVIFAGFGRVLAGPVPVPATDVAQDASGLPQINALSTYCQPSNECTFAMRRDLSRKWTDSMQNYAAIYDTQCNKIGFSGGFTQFRGNQDMTSQLPYVLVITDNTEHTTFHYGAGVYRNTGKGKLSACGEGHNPYFYECTSVRFSCDGFVGQDEVGGILPSKY